MTNLVREESNFKNIRIKYGNDVLIDKASVEGIFELDNKNVEDCDEILYVKMSIFNRLIEVETNYERLKAIDIKNKKIRIEINGGKNSFLRKLFSRLDNKFMSVVEEIYENSDENIEVVYNNVIFKEEGIRYFEVEFDENIKFVDEENNLLDLNNLKLDKKCSYQARFILFIEGILITSSIDKDNVSKKYIEILPKIKCGSVNFINMNIINNQKLKNIYFSQKGFIKNIEIDFTCLYDEPEFQKLTENIININIQSTNKSSCDISDVINSFSQTSDEKDTNSQTSDEKDTNSQSSDEKDSDSIWEEDELFFDDVVKEEYIID